MPLSLALMAVLLARPCPSCSHKLEKPGVWFKVIKTYRCDACHVDIPMDYEAKLKLFEAHAHLIGER